MALFFVLTYAVAWTLWAAAAAVTAGWSDAGARALVFLPGTFAPALVALLLTARAGGSAAVGALLGRLAIWDVGLRWYIFAVGYLAAVKLAAAVLHRAVAGAWPQFGPAPWYLLLAAVAGSTLFQAGEEIGWRGFALPRLGARVGLAGAGVVLGVIWALWHLPLFFIPETTTTGQSFPVYILAVTALSVAMTWLHAGTGGSLLLVMVMHAAVNNTKDVVMAPADFTAAPLSLSAPLISWLTVAVLWLGAAYFGWRLVVNGRRARSGDAA